MPPIDQAQLRTNRVAGWPSAAAPCYAARSCAWTSAAAFGPIL